MNTFRIALAVAACTVVATAHAQVANKKDPKWFPPQTGGGQSSLVGGSDDCSTADPIAGLGSFAVTTTGATDSAQQTGSCPTAHNDVWFKWTSGITGNVIVSLCGGTTSDTVLAVYPGSVCPASGSQIACNDDSCGLQSQVTFSATSGNDYMIQIGSFGATVTYSGTFTIATPPPPTGNDDCTMAVVISGPGTYPVNTTGATDSPQQPAVCTAIHKDVWFEWTATSTGSHDFRLCGGTTVDTKIAVYPGPGCPVSGSSIACNDDYCGLQSQLSFNATSGSVYMLQIGAFGTTTTFTGTFEIRPTPPPPVNDDCSTPIAISGPGPFPFDNTMATTGSQGQSEALCNQYATTGITDDEWYTWTPSLTGTATFTNCGGTAALADTKVAIYDGAGCPVAGTALACNDDEGYPGTLTCTSNIRASTATWNTVCGHVYTIQLGRYPGATASSGTFTITEVGNTCSTGSAYCFGDGTGTACPCGNSGTAGNGCANSLNVSGANLTASGSASIAGDTVVLTGSGMPNSSALYFQGTSQISIVFGDGLRCVGGAVIRLGTKSNVAGGSQYPQVGDPSVSVRGLDSAGDVRTYQVWYRNAAAFCTVSTFNLSNGYGITWLP